MRGNIIVVDDESGPRESLRMILKPDHDVRTADSGAAALAEVAREVPDLMFLDLRMPEMDGTELMRRVKADHPEVEVAIITAHAGVDSARIALRLGAVDYLTKPYSVADVQRIAEKALATRRRKLDAKVLTAQLAKMAEAMVSADHAASAEPQTAVKDALHSLETVQGFIGQDLGTIDGLRELGEATAQVSHDVNNLLTVILASAEALTWEMAESGEPDSQKVAARAGRIVSAARSCTDMMGRIKEFVRPSCELHPVDVNAVVAGVIELMREEPSAGGPAVRLVQRLQPVPLVRLDPTALQSALMNLIENSLHAIDAEGVIEITTQSDCDDVTIRVADNGCGMSPEVLANATQPFFTSRASLGTGLGLSIVDKLARRLQGQLAIESKEGQGTSVTLRIPISPPAEVAETSAAPVAKGTVLLVEDEDTIRDLMATVLATEGYEVVSACDGAEGWEAFNELRAGTHQPRMLVVTDHEMPRMMGRELTERIKAAAPEVPVLLVSAYVCDPDGPEDALVCKPFAISDLLSCVREYMPPADAPGSPALPALDET